MIPWAERVAKLTAGVVVSTALITGGPVAQVASAPSIAIGSRVASVTGSAGRDGSEAEVVRLTNRARAHARSCGGSRMKAVKPVHWNKALATSANKHSADMATRNYFSHNAPNGSSPFDRIRSAGYRYRAAGENIAAGQSLDSAHAVVQAWLNSPPHCKVIMNGKYRDLGVARVSGPGKHGIYWTANFGAR